MRKFRNAFACALTTAAMSAAASSAFAACGPALMNGNWQFFALQNATPGIKTITQTVKSGGGANIQVKVFNGNPENGISTAIQCSLTIAGANATGANISGTCSSQNNIKADSGSGIAVNGSVTLDSCTVTNGTLMVTGDTQAVTFLGGQFNGVMGTGIARQDHQGGGLNAFTQLFLWTMLKD